MKSKTAWTVLAMACCVAAMLLAVFGASWAQTTTNSGLAVVKFKLTGITPTGQPLAATVNPTTPISLRTPPAVVTVTGGRPPYTAECSSSFFEVAPSGNSTFTVKSIRNATGTIVITVTDSAGDVKKVTVKANLTFG
jgi:hypothetical protein